MEYSVAQAYDLLLKNGELTRLEAKKCTQVGDSVMQSICAFANTLDLNGGYLLLGVSEPDDTHEHFWVSGVDDVDNILNTLQINCRTQFEQPIAIQTCVEKLDGKTVILVYAAELDNHAKPCPFVGKLDKKNKTGVWLRGANGDYEATQKELEPLLLAKAGQSFEQIYLPDAEWEDLDLNAINRYRDLREKVHPEAPELQENNQEMLYAMQLVNRKNQYKPNIAGLLLFGKATALRRLLPAMRVDYVRVQGNEWQQEHFIETLDLREPLIYTIPKLESKILSDMPHHFRLKPNQLQRSDTPLLPQRVVRETIVNAVMHRDYGVNQPISIVRYDDRLEVKNAGYSLKPLSELGTAGSKTRNAILASALYDIKFAENKGSGIGVIKRQLRQAMLTEPTFDSNLLSNHFCAIYPFSQLLNENQLVWLSKLTAFELDNNEVMALVLAKENGQVNNAELCGVTDAHSEQAGKVLGRLVKVDLLVKGGTGRGAYYVLSDFAKSLLPDEQQSSELNDKSSELNDKSSELNDEKRKSLPEKSSELSHEILGKRASKAQMQQVIMQLCQTPQTLAQLVVSTSRTEATLRPILRELVRTGSLKYLYENNPTHPAQAYISTQPDNGAKQ